MENTRVIYLLNRAKSLLDSVKMVYEMEMKDSSQYNKMNGFSSHKTIANQVNALAIDVHKEFPDSYFMLYDTSKMKGPFDSLYMYRKDIFDGCLIEVGKIKAYLESMLGEDYEEIKTISQLIKSKLRSIIRTVPVNEIEVQDKVEDLFIAAGYTKGTDFDRETGRVKTGVKESTPDFIFRSLDFCIEIKIIKEKKEEKRIVEQINADVTSYSTKYGNILFVIYDIGGVVQNVDEFKYNIEGKKTKLEIVKH